MPAVLVVEDESAIAELIAINLRHAGFEVTLAENADQAQMAVDAVLPDLVLLDWMLPGASGVDFTRRLRSDERTRTVPIIMLTARSEEPDKIAGLESGADDYLAKPFSVLELQARVKALLRRGALNRPAVENRTRLHFDGLQIDIERRQVLREARDQWLCVDLTSTEFDLLLYLAQQPGKVFNRSQLLNDIWGYHHEAYEHTVNSHINRLRNKIEVNAAEPRYVRTVWGVGYKFMSEDL